MNDTSLTNTSRDAVQEAVQLLVQFATENGVPERTATPEDLVAAACAVHLWRIKYNTTTLEYPNIHGHEAVVELANIISRAAGHRTLTESQPLLLDAEMLPEHIISSSQSVNLELVMGKIAADIHC